MPSLCGAHDRHQDKRGPFVFEHNAQARSANGRIFVTDGALIVRAPHAPTAEAGARVDFLPLIDV